MEKQRYTLTNAQRVGFASIFVLDKMVRKGRKFAVAPTDPDEMALKDVIQTLFNERLIDIQGAYYVPTEEGKERVRRFRQRYEEYLTVYDIYCAVDLATGEFAFERYYDFDDDGWRLYLQQERWEDLRVAVAIYKKLDPVEIVFMSFVMEGRFDNYADGKWELGVLSGELWDEILAIVNSNLHPCELGYTTTDPNDPSRTIEVTPDDVMHDLLTRGGQIMLELVRRGKEIEAEQQALQPTTTTTTTTTETVYDYDFVIADPYVYYTPYLSPYYVSPVWTAPLYPTMVVVF
ncbi:MAG: hypothetical protein NZ585_12275 [Chloracidobacterium sp.]|nr:hypothetical protein [Chloracidobacterium sp.]MDW8216202.1 hypothetical protein [Acidobacteriota bacterium]